MTFNKFIKNIIFHLYKPLFISFSDIGNIATFGLFEPPDQPAAPDYRGAAEETSAGNLAMAREAVQANRANQFTPWGSSTWTRPTTATGEYDPTGTWTQTVNLTPEQQRLFETGTQTSQSMADLGLAGITAAGDIFRSPADFSSVGELKNYDDYRAGIMENMLSRVNTQIAQDREAAQSQLIAQGIQPGTEAFAREMQRIDQKATDARQQAELAATQQTGQMLDQAQNIRRQKIQEILTQRQLPLNELNALRSGNQVTMPQFSAVPQQEAVAGPDYMGATTAQGQWDLAGWNAENAYNNMWLQGLMGVGAAYVGGG